MRAEILHIQSHDIPYEIYESELKTDRRDKNPITLLSFVFKALPSPLLDDIAAGLWTEVARRYLTIRKELQGKSDGEVLGRISFECDGAHIEYEFSRLTKKSLLNLVRISQFVKQYPHSQKIRISRDGPILVRFRNDVIENTALGKPGKDAPLRFQAWASGVGGVLSHLFRRRG